MNWSSSLRSKRWLQISRPKISPFPVRQNGILGRDVVVPRDLRQCSCLTQLLAALHPYVGDVFIVPGALDTVYALEG